MKRRGEVIDAVVFFVIVLAIVCVIAAFILDSVYDKGHKSGYESGQIDALEGRWHYQRVELADGSVTYPKIDPDKAKEQR